MTKYMYLFEGIQTQIGGVSVPSPNGTEPMTDTTTHTTRLMRLGAGLGRVKRRAAILGVLFSPIIAYFFVVNPRK